MQLTHYTTTFPKKQFPIVVICDNISNASNIGSLFRIADAFGVEKLIFCGEGISISRKATKTSRSTEKVVPFELNCDIESVVSNYIENGYQIVALEITTNSLPLREYKLQANNPIALIIGDENFGVSETILNTCNLAIHIEMYGQNSSMNAVQATSIALYEITKQLNEF